MPNQIQCAEIGVHLHLYYEDLADEFCEYFQHIPESFDLYVSVKNLDHLNELQKKFQKISNVNQVVLKETPNRGRDIAPFYVLFREELQNHKYLLHVHSKKSLYKGKEDVTWRRDAMDGVLKDASMVKEVLRLFREERAGIVCGEMTDQLPLDAFHWLGCKEKAKEFLPRIGIPFSNDMFFYPIGSFFWAKQEAISDLFQQNLTYEDFDEEDSQLDGTLAHVLERVVALVSEKNNFKIFVYNNEEKVFYKDFGRKPIKNYFRRNVESIGRYIAYNCDVVSFDIFETLITRINEELYIPRKDIKNLFEYVKECKKRIILLSDTCLPRQTVEDILHRCGIEGYDELWLSSELKLSEEDGSMWDAFFEKYPQKTIHIGNDPVLDCNRLAAREKTYIFTPSPKDLARFSDDYEKIKALSTDDVGDVLTLTKLVNEGKYNEAFYNSKKEPQGKKWIYNQLRFAENLLAEPAVEGVFSVEQILKEDVIHISGWSFVPNMTDDSFFERKLLLKDPYGKIYEADVDAIFREDVSEQYGNGVNYRFAGFECNLNKDDLKVDTIPYQLGIKSKSAGKTYYSWGDAYLNSDYMPPKEQIIESFSISEEKELHESSLVEYEIESLEKNEDFVKITGWAFCNGNQHIYYQPMLGIIKDDKLMLSKLETYNRGDVALNYPKVHYLYRVGFAAVIRLKNMSYETDFILRFFNNYNADVRDVIISKDFC
ncbi:MAG: hypothetical protein K6F30_03500 [Lachnospiraceae bacterium]|nr:hypothetical protein [Lachnospiraceae bacterium]